MGSAAGAVAGGLIPALLLVTAAAAAAAAHAHIAFGDIKFSYAGATGPSHWGSLSPDFAACSRGKQQSPVDIRKKDLDIQKKCLHRDYRDANATLINNVFNLGVLMESDAGVLVLAGKNYTLKQVHWHSPSEHAINGIRHAAELHLVHKSGDGGISVVAVLFKLGKPDPFLDQVMDELEAMDSEGTEDHVPVGILKIKQLERRAHKYYRYVGSLTVPPCTENITWSILGKVREISLEQLQALRKPLGPHYRRNARPLQILNGRKMELHQC